MNKATPIYKVIYQDLVSRIEKGDLAPGKRIPTEAEWAREYGVSRITSKKALDMAAENRIIHRIPGKGSFVTENPRKTISRNNRSSRPVYGIIQHDLADSFGIELFQTLEQIAQEAGILIMAGFSNNDKATEQQLIKNFLSYGVDAFIISPVHDETFNNEILKLIIEGFPVVLIDRYLKDVSCPNVISRNMEAAAQGLRYLYSLGHRSIGVLSRPISSATTLAEREKGIMQAATELGMKLENRWWLTDLKGIDTKNEISFLEDCKRIELFLRDNPGLTALFGLKYSTIPAATIAAKRLGKSIPEDLSLLCFGSPGFLSNHLQPVTHLKQDEAELARRAFCLIEKMLNGEKVEYRHEVEVTLVMGETTAPPAGPDSQIQKLDGAAIKTGTKP